MSVNVFKAGWLWDDLRLASERVKTFDAHRAERLGTPEKQADSTNNNSLQESAVPPTNSTICS